MSGKSAWAFSQPSPTALFCPDCHSILNLPNAVRLLKCPDCMFSCDYSEFANHAAASESVSQVIHVGIETEKEAERRKKQKDAKGPKRATIKENCPKCGHDEMTFYTLQLRSVDEGQTVFYECEKCGVAIRVRARWDRRNAGLVGTCVYD